MRSFDLGPVDRVTAGAVGEPGQRIFFVQARAGTEQVTLLAEKEQVGVLATALEQLLATLPEGAEGDEPDPSDLDLQEPLEPAWRAGSIAIEYDEDFDGIEITIQEAGDDDDEEGEDEDGASEDDRAVARFVVSRAQARAMSQHALAVVAAGRPRCQFCGEPLEGEEHVCPAMNGHKKPAS